MSNLTVPLPPLLPGQHVEIEVRVAGRPKHHAYRVEAMPWHVGPHDDRIDMLRAFIARHEPEWLLVQVGRPTDGVLPITFRRRLPAGPAASPTPSDA